MSDFIDQFGEVVDKVIKEEHVKLIADFPEGTFEPKITSSFEAFAEGKHVFELYLCLYVLKAIMKNLVNGEIVDPEKTDDLIDSIIELVKHDLKEELSEAAGDENE